MRARTPRLIASSLLSLAIFAGATARYQAQACAAETAASNESATGVHRCDMGPDCECGVQCESGAQGPDSCQVQPASPEPEVAAMATPLSPLNLDVAPPPHAQPVLFDTQWICGIKFHESDRLPHGPPPSSEHERAPPSR